MRVFGCHFKPPRSVAFGVDGIAVCGSLAGLGRAQLCFVVLIATDALWQAIEITTDFLGPPLS